MRRLWISTEFRIDFDEFSEFVVVDFLLQSLESSSVVISKTGAIERGFLAHRRSEHLTVSELDFINYNVEISSVNQFWIENVTYERFKKLGCEINFNSS